MELEEFKTRKKEFTKRSPRDHPLAIEFIYQSKDPPVKYSPLTHSLPREEAEKNSTKEERATIGSIGQLEPVHITGS